MPTIENRNLIPTQKARRELRHKIVEALELERLRRGLEQTSFCWELGINAKTWWRIKTGNGEGVTLDTLVLYAIRVSVPVGILVAGEKFEIKPERKG